MLDLQGLNDAQRKAVTWEGGPLLVLAGPGSGKTFTIVKRISYLLEQGVLPEQILVITFTKEAALSMQRRFQEESKRFCPVNFGTFHSVFYHILKESHFIDTHKIWNQTEKLNKMLSLLKKYRNVQGKGAAADNLREDAVGLLTAISYYKNTFQWEEALSKVPVSWQNDFGEIHRLYEEAVSREKALDFDDMMFLCRKLLKENAGARAHWQKRFAHILIDEFQDINPVQYEIIKLLSAPPHHVFAVGDDDQSIYGFRGSSPDCLRRFQEEFGAAHILLNKNYRSGKRIIEKALAVMSESRNRFEKQILRGRTEQGEGKVELLSFLEREQEFAYLSEQLRGLQEQSKETGEKLTVAVLFRTNSAMQRLAARLRQGGIAIRMKERAKSIYEHFIVKDIMAYLLLAEGSADRELLLRIGNKPNRQISRELAFDDERLSAGIRQLKNQLKCMKDFAPQLAVTYVRKAVGYERYLRQLAAGKREQWEEWQELLDWLKSDAANYATASEWQEAQNGYGEELEQGRKKTAGTGFAVQLMTVHAAKGLEFDSVFIPDCNEGVFPYGHMIDGMAAEEERRILYVAMTRARKSLRLLYLTGTEKNPRLPSRFLNPLLYSSSSSTSSSNSQLSRYSSKASETFSYSSSSSMKESSGSSFGSSGFSL